MQRKTIVAILAITAVLGIVNSIPVAVSVPPPPVPPPKPCDTYETPGGHIIDPPDKAPRLPLPGKDCPRG